jgi:hypothetical protein
MLSRVSCGSRRLWVTRRSTRRWWTVVAVVTVLGVLAGGYASAWERRTAPTAPAWPVVAREPYVIALGPDGCPVIEERGFVDAPGQLVPPDATEVLLCTIPTVTLLPNSGVVHPPRQPAPRSDARTTSPSCCSTLTGSRCRSSSRVVAALPRAPGPVWTTPNRTSWTCSCSALRSSSAEWAADPASSAKCRC